MGTMQRLNAYASALEKWEAKKRRIELNNKVVGRSKEKPLEDEPALKTFEIGQSEMEWAEKIRRKILAPKVPMPTLDSQLPKIKMPVRKI